MRQSRTLGSVGGGARQRPLLPGRPAPTSKRSLSPIPGRSLNRPGFPGGSILCEEGAATGRHSTHYPAEVWDRAVRLVFEHQGEYGSQWASMCSIAAVEGERTFALDRDDGGSKRQRGLANDALQSVAAVEMVAGLVFLTDLEPPTDSVGFRLVHSQFPQSLNLNPIFQIGTPVRTIRRHPFCWVLKSLGAV